MRRAADHERAGPQLDQGCKNCVEVAFGAHMQDMDLQPEGASCRPQVFRGGLGELRTSRVDEQSNDGLRRLALENPANVATGEAVWCQILARAYARAICAFYYLRGSSAGLM
jgi:hypothetical protein